MKDVLRSKLLQLFIVLFLLPNFLHSNGVGEKHKTPIFTKASVKISDAQLNFNRLTLNGQNPAVIDFGQPITVNYAFLSAPFAVLDIFLDINKNGVLDEGDFPLMEAHREITDGDENDLDGPENGTYTFEIYGNDPPISFITGLDMFVAVSEAADLSVAMLTVLPLPDAEIIYGTVIFPQNQANLVVSAEQITGYASERLQVIAFTDELGNFELHLPPISGAYEVYCGDYLRVLDGDFIPPPPALIQLGGPIDLILFSFIEATAAVTGNVSDELGNPIMGARVYAEGGIVPVKDNPGPKLRNSTETDEFGNYHLGLLGGMWRIGLSSESLQPDFLAPHEDSLFITNGQTIDNVDFVAFSTNSTISGLVVGDEGPVPGIGVGAWSPVGHVWMRTDESGNFTFYVPDNLLFEVSVSHNDLMPGMIVVPSHYSNVAPGTDDLLFEIQTLNSSIEGFVVDAQTGYGIPNVGVDISNIYNNNEPGGNFFTSTDGEGYYFIALNDGEYNVHFSAIHLGYDNKDTTVTVPFETGLHVNVSLQKINFGFISGTVSDISLNGIDSADVIAIPLRDTLIIPEKKLIGDKIKEDPQVIFGRTNEFGEYLLQVPPGLYQVRAKKKGFVAEFFDDVTRPDFAIPVPVYAGDTTKMIDFQLEPGGSVSGMVFDQNGYPLMDGTVFAIDTTGHASGDFNRKFHVTKIQQDGFYQFDGLNPGLYFIYVDIHGFEKQFYDKSPNLETASPIQVSIEDDIHGIDFHLVPSTGKALFEGFVYDSNNNVGIGGVRIELVEIRLPPVGGDKTFQTSTDSSGYFQMEVAQGSYLAIADGKHLGYDRVEIPVLIYSNYYYQEFYLGQHKFGFISGFVSDGSAPLDSTFIVAFQDYNVPTKIDIPLRGTHTDENGFYVLELPVGKYFVNAMKENYISEFYDDAIYFENATPVFVLEDDTTSNIDFVLGKGSSLSGYVYNAAGSPVKFGEVAAIDTTGFDFKQPNYNRVFFAPINDDGSYMFFGLPPGDFFVRAASEGFMPQFYNLSPDYKSATPVQIVSGLDVSGIDFYLEKANEFPIIQGIWDVPQDQGLQVQIVFRASAFDSNEPFDFRNIDVTSYSVWRGLEVRVPTGAISYSTSAEYFALAKEFKPGDQFIKGGIIWTFIGGLPAIHHREYGYVAPTLLDSTTINDGITAFMVVAHGDHGDVYESMPEFGYSIDNLKPKTPGEPGALFDGTGIHISWKATDDPDIIFYRVYKSLLAGFAPSALNLIVESEEYSFFDATVTPGNYYYKVSALDDAFNESFTEELHVLITGIESDLNGIPTEFVVHQNYPNPFNPVTTLRYGLPESANVTISVYDILGKRIATLTEGYKEAGYHKVDFDGSNMSSGIYFYQVESGKFREIRKMILMK